MGWTLRRFVDFSQPGELGAITDEATLSSMAEMDALGTVDASELARAFSLQRRNDLLWSFVVNNYLLGKDAFPQELLHWIVDWMPLPVVIVSASECMSIDCALAFAISSGRPCASALATVASAFWTSTAALIWAMPSSF